MHLGSLYSKQKILFFAQVSQRVSQISITLNVLDEEVSEAKKLQNLAKTSGTRPVHNRLQLLWVRLNTISANDVTQIRQFSLAPNTFGSLDSQLMVTQLR